MLEANIAAMASHARRAGVALRPHAKTHKCLEIAQRQIAAGAVGLTVATVGEAEVLADAGVEDLFIAYPLWAAGQRGRRLRALAGRTRLRVGVDSTAGAQLLAAALGGAPAEVVVEVDSGHHRTGVAPAAAPAIATAAERAGLVVAGVFTFPGHSYAPDAAALAAVDERTALEQAAAAMARAGLACELRSGGSTPTAGRIDGGVSELRPGVYVFGDAQQLELGTITTEQIALWAAAHGGPIANPAEDPAVRAVMTGIRRHPGVAPPRRRTAARTDAVNTITDGLDPGEDAVDARDLALILVAFGAGLRRSDLERLDLDDLTAGPDGLSVRIRRSKTDQQGAGTTRGISVDDQGHCPAAEAFELWRAHLARAGVTRGPVRRPIDRARSGRLTIRASRLSGQSIDTIITRRAAQAGLEGNYGSHSLRRGLATEALAAGHAEHVVMRHGRWRSRAAMDPYIDDAQTFDATNPTRTLGLRSLTVGDASPESS